MAFYKPAAPIFLSDVAAYIPSQEISNEKLIEWMGASIKPSWITSRTGIETRRWVRDDEAVSDIAFNAANTLLQRFPDAKQKISQLILATISGDYPSPPTSPLLQERLGLQNVGCFDLSAACAGFVTGLYNGVALSFATSEDTLLVTADIRSKFLNKHDLATSVLFGDGAAACLISNNPKIAAYKFLAGELLSDGSVADIISIQAGGSRLPHHLNTEPENHFLKMKQGSIIFLKAAEGMSLAAKSLLEKLDLQLSDIDYIVPHQANLRLMREVARLLDFPNDKVVEVVQFLGNTSGSSVALALNHLAEKKVLKPSQKILLVAAGGGGLAATALLEKT